MNISIRLLIVLGFSAVIAILGTVNLLSAFKLGGLDKASSQINNKTEIVRLTNDFVSAIDKQEAALRLFARSGLESDKDQVIIHQNKTQDLLDKIIPQLQGNGQDLLGKRLTASENKFGAVLAKIQDRLGNEADALQVVVVGLVKLQKSSASLAEFLSSRDEEVAQNLARQLPGIINRYTTFSVAYASSGVSSDFDGALKAGEELETIFKSSAQMLRNLPRRQRSVVRFARRDSDVVRQSLRQKNATMLAVDEAMLQLTAASNIIDKISARIQAGAREEQSSALSTMDREIASAIKNGIWGLALGGVTAMLFAWGIGVSIVNPIAKISRAMDALAAGDKTVDIPFRDRSDELGHLADAAGIFKDRAFELERVAEEKAKAELETAEAERKREAEREALIVEQQREERAKRSARQEARRKQRLAMADEFEKRVVGVVDALNKASREVSVASKSLANNTEETKTQVERTYKATNDASHNVQSVAGATEELAVSFGNVGYELSHSASVAKDAVKEASRTTGTMQGLEGAADKIGIVVKMIQEIAEQTNLLSLNATIEAARAGEAGKGFAVVAQEVKNLASQSSDATFEISNYVKDIQAVASDAGDAIDRITKIITNMDDITQSVVVAVNQQTLATQEIAHNVQNVASGTESVLDSVGIVGGAAEETQSMAHRLQANAEELTKETEALGFEVHRFLEEVRSDKDEALIEDAGNDNIVMLKSA